jgi:hypothetical protein
MGTTTVGVSVTKTAKVTEMTQAGVSAISHEPRRLLAGVFALVYQLSGRSH